jgi:hypothetical protein
MNKSSNTWMVQIDQSNEQLKEIRKPRNQCMVGPGNEAGLHWIMERLNELSRDWSMHTFVEAWEESWTQSFEGMVK